MSAESNKAQSRRFFDEAFGQGKMEVINEIYDTHHVNRGPGSMPGLPDGPEGMRQYVSYYRNAFPDTHFTIDEQIAEGDRVVTRWTAHGTHKGELPGIPVTGKAATVSGMTVDRFANGKIVESWGLFDQMGMMQQLGAMQSQEQSRSKR
jgi:steroid delta-isomerase-like uncharacterized protein